MGAADARGWSQAEQERVRRLAVRAVGRGLTYVVAAEQFGVSEMTISRWMRRHREGGEDGLAARRRGRRPGDQQALSVAQQKEVAHLIDTYAPPELNVAGHL